MVRSLPQSKNLFISELSQVNEVTANNVKSLQLSEEDHQRRQEYRYKTSLQMEGDANDTEGQEQASNARNATCGSVTIVRAGSATILILSNGRRQAFSDQSESSIQVIR